MVASSAEAIRAALPRGVSQEDVAVFTSRILRAQKDFEVSTGIALNIEITANAPHPGISTIRQLLRRPQERVPQATSAREDELSLEERAERYQATPPKYDASLLIVPEQVRESIQLALDFIQFHKEIFEEMGLKRIEPSPSVALSFYGEPGTGKTLAAHALAAELGKPILLASYSELESKFRGEGTKNLQALFYAAERDDALLFIDEADSLLSKRFTSVTQGAEEAANALRTEMAVALDQFSGIVIFCTNLIESYDPALASRVRCIHFPKPDRESREAIWRTHLVFEGNGTLAPDVSLEALAEAEEMVGRDINGAIQHAAILAARRGKPYVLTQADLLYGIAQVRASHVPQNGTFTEASAADPETEEKIVQAVKNRRSNSRPS